MTPAIPSVPGSTLDWVICQDERAMHDGIDSLRFQREEIPKRLALFKRPSSTRTPRVLFIAWLEKSNRDRTNLTMDRIEPALLGGCG
jgi:hypothetical protein